MAEQQDPAPARTLEYLTVAAASVGLALPTLTAIVIAGFAVPDIRMWLGIPLIVGAGPLLGARWLSHQPGVGKQTWILVFAGLYGFFVGVFLSLLIIGLIVLVWWGAVIPWVDAQNFSAWVTELVIIIGTAVATAWMYVKLVKVVVGTHGGGIVPRTFSARRRTILVAIVGGLGTFLAIIAPLPDPLAAKIALAGITAALTVLGTTIASSR